MGAASADITPPLDVGILMSSIEQRWMPFEGVSRPLLARAIVFAPAAHDAAFGRVTHGNGNGDGHPNGDGDGEVPAEPDASPGRIALVSLDLLGLSGKAFGGWSRFKRRIAAAAGDVVKPTDIVLACTHTHSAPESVALTDLCDTPAFAAWAEKLVARIGGAIRSAADAAVPCTTSVGSTTAPGLGIHRRIKTTEGIVLSHPRPADDIVVSRGGAVDDSVNVAAFRDAAGRLVAALVNATCHPVHEMCIPLVSPDYPGELCAALEEAHPGSVALFFNGAAGNINPTTVSGGADNARRHGRALAAAVERALATAAPAACEPGDIRLARRLFTLATRTATGRMCGPPLPAGIAALRLGDAAAFVFLPGEPFVETGLAVRAQSPFAITAVVGYAEETIGYVPTDQAFVEGGYETTYGRWSVVSLGSEPVLRAEAAALLRELKAPEAVRLRAPLEDASDVPVHEC